MHFPADWLLFIPYAFSHFGLWLEDEEHGHEHLHMS